MCWKMSGSNLSRGPLTGVKEFRSSFTTLDEEVVVVLDLGLDLVGVRFKVCIVEAVGFRSIITPVVVAPGSGAAKVCERLSMGTSPRSVEP